MISRIVIPSIRPVLKPQDVVLALYLTGTSARTQSEIAGQVGLSQGEVSNALKRLRASRLLLDDARTIVVPHLVELCVHGIKYVFPAEVGRKVGGMPTVALAPPLAGNIFGEEAELVWPSPRGTARAASLEPLHPCVVHAAERDERLYQLLSLLDGIRVGRARLREVAEKKFRDILMGSPCS